MKGSVSVYKKEKMCVGQSHPGNRKSDDRSDHLHARLVHFHALCENNRIINEVLPILTFCMLDWI